MKKQTTLIVTLIIALLLAGFWYLKKPNVETSSSPSQSEINYDVKTEPSTKIGVNDTAQQGLAKEYNHPVYNFKFKYPKDFTISRYPDADGEVVLVQNATSGHGFQIFTVPFTDSDTTITKERINSSDPTIKVSDQQNVTIGNSGKGLAFISGSGTDQKREVWFIYKGVLYEITTFKKDDDLLRSVLSTWIFNK